MNIGSIGYACHSGLGHLLKDFYDHGIIQKVLLVRHPNYPNHPEWYGREHSYDRGSYRRFLDGLDALLLFENAFLWDVVKYARIRGIKIILQPNYEYTPFPIPVKPDLVMCPSLLDQDYYKDDYQTCHLPTPVNLKANPWKHRQTARVFVHNAGHGGRGFRNGTEEILQSIPLIKSDIRLIIRGQPEEPRIRKLLKQCRTLTDPRVTVVSKEVATLEELWRDGDVSLDAQKYNGQSLPLQEAFASGMLVMSTDRYPMNTWLPVEPLIRPKMYVDDRIAVTFKRAVVTPDAIAEKVDSWYGKDISAFSLDGEQYGKDNCWEMMKPVYLKVLESV